jgi:hypothetical protein
MPNGYLSTVRRDPLLDDLALDCPDALDPLSSTAMLPIRSAGEERSSALVNRHHPRGGCIKIGRYQRFSRDGGVKLPLIGDVVDDGPNQSGVRACHVKSIRLSSHIWMRTWTASGTFSDPYSFGAGPN